MIVLDASALVEQLLDTSKGLQLHQRCLGKAETIHSPHLVDLEVTQGLRRYCQQGLLSTIRASQAMEDLMAFPLIRYAHESFLPRIWELGENLTAYDAAFVALDELLDTPLVTCDTRLAAAPGHSAIVEVF